MNLYGLIGFPLSHSFSKKYFTEKFEKEGITNAQYELFEIETINLLENVLKTNEGQLKGFNITIPHKETVIPYLDEVDDAAKRIGAINVVKVLSNGKLKGYNSDYYGFLQSLKSMVGDLTSKKALILGTGGASKAVRAALEDIGVPYQYVSRKSSKLTLAYEEVTPDIITEHSIIINTTPLGMSPNIDKAPDLPYEAITSNHFLFDLVYNPLETKFMRLGAKRGAKVKNGLEMLELQAEKAWEIWNN